MDFLSIQPPDFQHNQLISQSSHHPAAAEMSFSQHRRRAPQAEQPGCNKLQTHKSSFQSWKCVSFGCSLLALVLLLSKWYEVTTDLHLLTGIDRLLSVNIQQQQQQTLNSSTSGTTVPLSWPPVPLDQLLPSFNESSSSFGMGSMDSNSSMLMSHMQMNLNRELNGDQLLRQEVEMFVVEFRNAKSTLSLSCLLVIVYLISWILMTLAINDARISNDISLRNILLLSTFGAIDIAASIGFVMVRIIMYNVKNKPFASDLIGSAGLKESQVRLSADQLTAFTALRMISMRSCAAYMDIYVSVIVTLLTILRLYAILRALTYYRRLRNSNDAHQQGRLEAAIESSQQQQVAAAVLQASVRSDKSLWSQRGPFFEGGHFRPSSMSNQNGRRRTPERGRLAKGPNQGLVSDHPMMQFADQQHRKYSQMAPLSLDTGVNLLGFGVQDSEITQKIVPPPRAATLSRKQLPHQFKQIPIIASLSRQTTSNRAEPILLKAAAQLGSGNISTQTGRRASSQHNGMADQAANKQRLFRRSASSDRDGSIASSDEICTDGAQADNLQNLFTLRPHSSSQTNLISLEPGAMSSGESRAKRPKVPQKSSAFSYNTIKSNGTTYALLTADQLTRISKKMLGGSGGSANNSHKITQSMADSPKQQISNLKARYRLMEDRGDSLRKTDSLRIERVDSGLADPRAEELDLQGLSSVSSSPLTSSGDERAGDSGTSGQRKRNPRSRENIRQQVTSGIGEKRREIMSRSNETSDFCLVDQILKMAEEQASYNTNTNTNNSPNNNKSERANKLGQYYYA